MSVPSARQASSGIRLVATNQYRNPIRRQISGYGAPVSAPNDYGSPVAEVVDVRGKDLEMFSAVQYIVTTTTA